MINDPTIVAEVTALYLQYEEALCTNDLQALDSFFWESPEVLRFGTGENLYGIEAIRDFRQHRPTANLARQISQLKVVTLGQDTAAVTLEFQRMVGDKPRAGRQSQMWYRFPDVGWKVVSAHVSFLSP